MLKRIIRLTITVIFFFVALSSLPLRAGEAQEKDAFAYKQAYNQVLEEKWAEAFKAMEAMVREYPKSAWTDDARFWQCYAREKLGQPLEGAEHLA